MLNGRVACGTLSILLIVGASQPGRAHTTQQWTPDKPGSDNIEVVAHLPLGPRLSVADIEIEQELHRPFVYIARMVYGSEGEKGTDIINIEDPANPKIIYRWRIENQDLHLGGGGMDVKYFKWNDSYYLVQSVQFNQGGPNSAMGAVVFDVTGLPDPATVKEVARIQAPRQPNGFHNIFIYTHTSGRVLLFATTEGSAVNVYDLGNVVEDRPNDALIATVPAGPGTNPMASYHDMYVAYHVDSEQDRFYGAGTGGYYVYNLTDITNPELLVSLTEIEGVKDGHTFAATPDGRYVVAETEYRYAPLRIFDLKPALDGEVSNIRVPISAWTADWRHLVHNHEIRWPYVFVSGYMDGLQVFSLMDPYDPVTVAYYDTYVGPLNTDVYPTDNGAFGIDVRNADGLIVISDMTTGFWAFRMDGFLGWKGSDWGIPDISSAQKWSNGGR